MKKYSAQTDASGLSVSQAHFLIGFLSSRLDQKGSIRQKDFKEGVEKAKEFVPW